MTELLLVVDLQEGFRFKETEKTIPKISNLLESFEGKTVFACFKNTPDSTFERTLGWEQFQGEEDTRILEEFRDSNYEKVFHEGYTVLNESLKKLIKGEGISEIYICGVYTDVCISKAAMDAFDQGFNVSVISDCCASPHGDKNHEAAIDTLKHVIGEDNVISIEELR